jgi:hypothetical protein
MNYIDLTIQEKLDLIIQANIVLLKHLTMLATSEQTEQLIVHLERIRTAQIVKQCTPSYIVE